MNIGFNIYPYFIGLTPYAGIFCPFRAIVYEAI